MIGKGCDESGDEWMTSDIGKNSTLMVDMIDLLELDDCVICMSVERGLA